LFTCCVTSCKGGVIFIMILAFAGFAAAVVGAVWDGAAAVFFNSFAMCAQLPRGNDDLWLGKRDSDRINN
jgi:hypothetical protein